MSLFDEKLAEVVLPSGTGFLLRRNPIRAEEKAAARSRRLAALQTRVDRRNACLEYIDAHRPKPRSGGSRNGSPSCA